MFGEEQVFRACFELGEGVALMRTCAGVDDGGLSQQPGDWERALRGRKGGVFGVWRRVDAGRCFPGSPRYSDCFCQAPAHSAAHCSLRACHSCLCFDGCAWRCPEQRAACATQGWRRTMEDAHIAAVDLGNSPDAAMFGVFDGHGGRCGSGGARQLRTGLAWGALLTVCFWEHETSHQDWFGRRLGAG